MVLSADPLTNLSPLRWRHRTVAECPANVSADHGLLVRMSHTWNKQPVYYKDEDKHHVTTDFNCFIGRSTDNPLLIKLYTRYACDRNKQYNTTPCEHMKLHVQSSLSLHWQNITSVPNKQLQQPHLGSDLRMSWQCSVLVASSSSL